MSGRSAESTPEVREHRFTDDGRIPNSELPLLVYPGALGADARDPARCKALFEANGWSGAWTDGVFSYHHYHSTSHEVLGVIGGEARVTFGGESGETLRVGAGDVVVIPAGVGHKNAGASPDFTVVGAYPEGRSWDVLTGEPGERPEALENIKNVPLPEKDPLFGESGPLTERWNREGFAGGVV